MGPRDTSRPGCHGDCCLGVTSSVMVYTNLVILDVYALFTQNIPPLQEFLQNDYQKVADDALQAIDELDSALFSNPVRLTHLTVTVSCYAWQRCEHWVPFFFLYSSIPTQLAILQSLIRQSLEKTLMKSQPYSKCYLLKLNFVPSA